MEHRFSIILLTRIQLIVSNLFQIQVYSRISIKYKDDFQFLISAKLSNSMDSMDTRNTGSRVHLNFRAGSTFPVPVCTVPTVAYTGGGSSPLGPPGHPRGGPAPLGFLGIGKNQVFWVKKKLALIISKGCFPP